MCGGGVGRLVQWFGRSFKQLPDEQATDSEVRQGQRGIGSNAITTARQQQHHHRQAGEQAGWLGELYC